MSFDKCILSWWERCSVSSFEALLLYSLETHLSFYFTLFLFVLADDDGDFSVRFSWSTINIVFRRFRQKRHIIQLENFFCALHINTYTRPNIPFSSKNNHITSMQVWMYREKRIILENENSKQVDPQNNIHALYVTCHAKGLFYVHDWLNVLWGIFHFHSELFFSLFHHKFY